MTAKVVIIVTLLCASSIAGADTQADSDLKARATARAAKVGGGGYPEGSAPAFVDRLCEDVALGADGEFVADAFDLDIMAPGLGNARTNLKEFLDGNLEEARAMAARGEISYLGWVVDHDVRHDDGVTWVHAQVVSEDLRGGGRVGVVTELRFALKGGPDWRITDLVTNGESLRADLARMVESMPHRMDEMVHGMIAAGDTDQAYELATRLVAVEPEHAEARATLARVLFTTYQIDAASDEIEKVLGLRPDDGGMLALRAQVALVRGDYAAARADAMRAAELGVHGAAVLVERLDVTAAARERLDGRRPELRPGSAAAFVDDIVERIAAGRSLSELAGVFAPELWSRASHPSVETVVAVLAVELGPPFGESVTPLGWHVSPNERRTDGRVHVSVEVPLVNTIGARDRDLISTSLERGTDGLDGELQVIRKMIAKLPADVRAKILDRLPGLQSPTVANIDVVLVGREGAWRIADIVTEGRSFRDDLPTLEENARRARRSTADLSRRLIVGGVIVAFAVGLVLVLIWRDAGRRRRRR